MKRMGVRVTTTLTNVRKNIVKVDDSTYYCGLPLVCIHRIIGLYWRVEAKTLNNFENNSFVKEILVTMLRRKALNVDNEEPLRMHCTNAGAAQHSFVLPGSSYPCGDDTTSTSELEPKPAPVVIIQPTGRPWLSRDGKGITCFGHDDQRHENNDPKPHQVQRGFGSDTNFRGTTTKVCRHRTRKYEEPQNTRHAPRS
nr:hypothetical protein [Tanacetum cinerariifolium]